MNLNSWLFRSVKISKNDHATVVLESQLEWTSSWNTKYFQHRCEFWSNVDINTQLQIIKKTLIAFPKWMKENFNLLLYNCDSQPGFHIVLDLCKHASFIKCWYNWARFYIIKQLYNTWDNLKGLALPHSVFTHLRCFIDTDVEKCWEWI